MKERALAISNGSIGYMHKGKPVAVVSNIDVSLHKGELVSLIGRNGAGKSTLLRTIAAFQQQLKGEFTIEGRNIADYSANGMAKLVSVVLSNADIAPLTVRELVSLGRTPHVGLLGRLATKDKRVVEQAMELMGVTQFASRMITTLSDGERQKCMIAKALAQETPIILLDEPTAFLDYPSKVRLLRMLKELAQTTGKAVLVSTHDIEIAFALTDKVWLLDNGHLYEGTLEELQNNGALQRFIDCDIMRYNTTDNKIEII